MDIASQRELLTWSLSQILTTGGFIASNLQSNIP